MLQLEPLQLDPEVAGKIATIDPPLLEDGPQASKGPFGKGGALEWVATASDALAAVTLAGLHAFDDKAVQDSSKNLQVLWSRALLANDGQLNDDIAYNLLPESTRGVVRSGTLDFALPWLEWVKARTEWLDVGCEAFLSSPPCADGAECQVLVFGAGFDTRSIRYQREGLRFFEVDLPETIEAKSVVHQRYQRTMPETRLPTLVGWDLNDCATSSLIDHLVATTGFKRDVPTMFISEAVMFYVDAPAIASLYNEIFNFGQKTQAMYCFTDSMRPFVQGPFSDESTTFFKQQGAEVLSHTARWGGAVQFVHAVAKTPGANALHAHVSNQFEKPITSYAPERALRPLDPQGTSPSFKNSWYALCYTSELIELAPDTPYATRIFGEPLVLRRDANGGVTCESQVGGSISGYKVVDHQGLVWMWRGDEAAADMSILPTHPTPDETHAVETILDYGVDWTYIVENNLDTPHLYWLHDGSIPPIEALGCNRKNVAQIALRFFQDDVGVGHIGKTKTAVTKIVRYDSPNVVRHGGVSGFSEEFNIIPLGPHRTRVLLRQRFPKGPILSTLLGIPGTAAVLQYLVRNWNYQIALEDYSVMQGQAHNIEDYGAPNWNAASVGDDLIVKFWQWKKAAAAKEVGGSEWFSRWDGSSVEAAGSSTHAEPSEDLAYLRRDYVENAPVAGYPPINYRKYQAQQGWILTGKAPTLGAASAVGGLSGLVAAAQMTPFGAAIAENLDRLS